MADDNFDEFIKKLKYLEEDIKNVGQQVTNRAINEGMAVSQKATPVKTGYGRTQWISILPKELETAGEVSTRTTLSICFMSILDTISYLKGKTVGYIPGKFFLEAGVEHMKRNLDRYFASEIKNIRGNWK